MAAIFDLKKIEEFVKEKKKNGEYPQFYFAEHPELSDLVKKYQAGEIKEGTPEAQAAKMLESEIQEYYSSPQRLIILEEYMKKNDKEAQFKSFLSKILKGRKTESLKKQLDTYATSSTDRANLVLNTLKNPKKELNKIMAEPDREPKRDVYELTEQELNEEIKRIAKETSPKKNIFTGLTSSLLGIGTRTPDPQRPIKTYEARQMR